MGDPPGPELKPSSVLPSLIVIVIGIGGLLLRHLAVAVVEEQEDSQLVFIKELGEIPPEEELTSMETGFWPPF